MRTTTAVSRLYRNHAARTALAFALLVLPAAALLAGEADGVKRLSAPVEVTEEHETFGSVMGNVAAPIGLSALLANGDEYVDADVLVTTRVAQVCQMKGCFFIAQDGDYTARVSFKDYGFFVPTDISGKTVLLKGQLRYRDVSAEQAEHYNADLEDADAVEPGRYYEIVATSVRVPLS